MLLYIKPAKLVDRIEPRTTGKRLPCCLISPYCVGVSPLLSSIFLHGPPPPSSVHLHYCSCFPPLKSTADCIRAAQSRAQKTDCMNCSFSIIGAQRPIAFRYVIIYLVRRLAPYFFSFWGFLDSFSVVVNLSCPRRRNWLSAQMTTEPFRLGNGFCSVRAE
jgi:hypothetical protein